MTGLTAWDALFPERGRRLTPGDTVLVLGSGGVSIFALQFALRSGARVIATTSSAAKVEKLNKMGAHHVINYTKDPNWSEAAKKQIPDGRGVNFVIETGGATTLTQSMAATHIDSQVAMVGFMHGQGGWSLALKVLCTIKQIQVGSRHLFEEINRAIECNCLEPIINKVFACDQAADAPKYLESGEHIGKVVIEIK